MEAAFVRSRTKYRYNRNSPLYICNRFFLFNNTKHVCKLYFRIALYLITYRYVIFIIINDIVYVSYTFFGMAIRECALYAGNYFDIISCNAANVKRLSQHLLKLFLTPEPERINS